MPSTSEPTVWHAFYSTLRAYGMTTIFGNPGSTEQPMLKNFPPDFTYVLGLQEASVVGMAGGFSEATRKPVLVSLHTSAGTGNGMGTIMTAYLTKIPLVIIAGQQTREMLIGEPMLTNREATTLPKPYVKWSYEPVRAVDVPAALVRGIATAMQPPMGPVYVSVPLDDWDVSYNKPVIPRTVSTRVGPDPRQLEEFSEVIREKAGSMALVLGAEVDKALAWDQAVELAELLACPVFQAPLSERAVFPEDHELYMGPLPTARGPLARHLGGFDLVLVVGAEVFRYYPWMAGPVLEEGTRLLHITNDPNDAAKAVTGDSLLSDAGLAIEGLLSLLKEVPVERSASKLYARPKPTAITSPRTTHLMTAFEAFSVVAEIRPHDAILCHETPSNTGDLFQAWQSTKPETSFTFASGGLGWNMPAAVGIAMAQKFLSTGRLTVLVIGDGSFKYSLQSLYTAVQNKLKLICLVPVNEEYAVLKEFAVLEETPNVPHLDLPGLNISASAKSWGCSTRRVQGREELQEAFKEAVLMEGPVVIEFPVDRALRPLMGLTAETLPKA